MPKMVSLIPAPKYKGETPAQKAAYDAIVKKGAMTVPYLTAMENVAQSGGMYAIASAAAEMTVAAPRLLEDMTSEELKVMMLSLGVKPAKQMKRHEVISLIRQRVEEVDIVDDEVQGA